MSRVDGSSKSVLIIEDSYIQAYALRKMLESVGFRRISISRTHRGIQERIFIEQPDLVFISAERSGKPAGIDLIEEVRSQFFNPVVFLTRKREPQNLDRIKALPNCFLLFKPCRYADVRELMKDLSEEPTEDPVPPGCLHKMFRAMVS